MTAVLIDDLKIMGWGVIPKDTKLEVIEKNSRYVYCDLCGNNLRLSTKDVKIIK